MAPRRGGIEAILSGPALAVRTCARRLAPFGALDAPLPDLGSHDDVEIVWRASSAPAASTPITCAISWHGPARLPSEQPGSEATIQARSGLMTVNGKDSGRPHRIGLEIASVAAGVLAAHGVLAAEIARRRGRPVERIETSALQAGLLLASHYVAAATAGGEQVPTAPGPEPGPPFQTADDRWFEIEVFDADAWKQFWTRLGASDTDLGPAWTSFRGRYYRGDCSFPPGLHEATRRHTLREAAEAAVACGVSLAPVRDYDEVRAEPGWSAGHPRITERLPSSGHGTDAAPQSPEHARSELPLAGFKVVEATNRMQGPLAGLLLQMLGAEVVKVEPPGGDVGRMVPPYAGDTGSFFLCFNRDKSTVQLDLRQSTGRSELIGLLDGADAFLHNWRPGRAAAWGLDADDLARHHPHLVYATASGWGDPVLDERLIGTDFLVQAHAGVGYGLHPEGEPPAPTRVLLTDFMGALVTAEGVLHGLYRRELEGAGMAVATSLLQGALALQAHVFEGLQEGPERGRRRGRPVWGPLDLPIETADGTLVVSADDERFGRLCEMCEADGAGSRADIERMVVDRLAGGSAAGWEKLLVEADVPAAAVSADLSALPDDPALVELFEPLSGTARAPRSPWRPSR